MLLGRLPVDSFIDRVCERDGELGNGGTLGARLVDEEPLWEVPVGDVGDVPLGGGPGLFDPPFLPPPLNRPLIPENKFDIVRQYPQSLVTPTYSCGRITVVSISQRCGIGRAHV